jgi:beta-lactamase superfamily II metal-dependent hydrolase
MTKSKRVRRVATYIAVGGMALIFLFDIATVLLCAAQEKRWPITREPFTQAGGTGGTRFHFLNTGNSDCILLESAGHFALIDGGWGSDNPLQSSRRPGYERRVIDYLKRVGAVDLDFILPTHYHYDHAGAIPYILADPDIRAGRVYLSPRDGHAKWDELEIRRMIEEAALARGFAMEEQLPTEPFAFGDMTLRFFNTQPLPRNENNNSVVVRAEYGAFRAAFLGDVYAFRGPEKELARQVGQVDLLKAPHHGYSLSSSAAALRALRPKLVVVTNVYGKVYPNVKWNYALVSRAAVLSTVRENGLVVTVGEHS